MPETKSIKKGTEISDDEIERKRSVKPKKPETKLRMPTSSDESETKSRRKKYHEKPIKKKVPIASEDTDDRSTMPTFRRLSRWVQRQVFKDPRLEVSDEPVRGEKGEGGSQKSSILSKSSSTELDKTYTSKRQRLLTFLSPSRRRKVKTFRKKMKKKIAPPVRAVVSESDYSSDVTLPPIDPSELKARIVTTGDCKKIDYMLVRNDWDRSFYIAHDFQTIGDREEGLRQHDPEERRKINTTKIVQSQAHVLGTLSKVSSAHSLQDMIGKSMRKAEVAASSPRAITAFDLKSFSKR